MNHVDYEELANGVDVMREVFRAMIAGLVEDGFTDGQARELVVSIFTNGRGGEDETG